MPKTFAKEQENKFKELRKGKSEQSIINFIKKFINKKPSDLDFNTFLDSMTKSDEIFSDFVTFVDCFNRKSKSFKLMSNTISSACQIKHIKYKQYYQKIVGCQDNKISKLIEKKEVYFKGIASDNLILKGK